MSSTATDILFESAARPDSATASNNPLASKKNKRSASPLDLTTGTYTYSLQSRYQLNARELQLRATLLAALDTASAANTETTERERAFQQSFLKNPSGSKYTGRELDSLNTLFDENKTSEQVKWHLLAGLPKIIYGLIGREEFEYYEDEDEDEDEDEEREEGGIEEGQEDEFEVPEWLRGVCEWGEIF
jgi:hypothetical protein